MRLGVHLIPDGWENVRRRAELADRLGFACLWMAESPFTVYEVFVALAVAAHQTQRIRLGPGCTNVVLHRDVMVASAVASLDELTGGRAVCAIGSGDTPVHMVGERPARLADLRHAVERIQALTEGRTVSYRGRPLQLRWANRRVPVYLTAEGPRTLELAGEVADGVLCGSGVQPEVVAWARDRVRQGLLRAGRRQEEVDVWFACMVSIGASPEEARERVRARVANRARHALLSAPETVPEDRRAEVQRLADAFDIGAWYHPKHGALVTDYMLDRFAVAGTVREVTDRLLGLRDLGIQALMVDLPLETFDEELWVLGEQVLPKLNP